MRASGSTATRVAVAVIFLTSLAGALGCIRAPSKSPMMARAENLQDMSAVQLRTHVHDFARRFTIVVEGAADRIIAASDDPAVKRAALRWKMNAISELHLAAFHPDPLVALLDVAVLSGQMVRFFETGAGRDRFGPWQEIAIEAARRLDNDVWTLGTSLSISGDVSRAKRDVDAWVVEHPIEDLLLVRESVQPLLARMADLPKTGAGAVLGNVNDTVSDLSSRLTLYAEDLPKQARWQAELMVGDMLAGADPAAALEIGASFADSFERVAATVEQTPDLVERERTATLETLRELTQLTLASINRQRVESIVELRREREEVLKTLVQERMAVIETLRGERAATTEEVGGIVASSLDTGFERAERLVDRIFWRAAILLGGFSLALLFVGLIVARSFRRPVRSGP